MTKAHYLVLIEDVTRADFAKAATALGFTRKTVWVPQGKGESYEEAWANSDQTQALSYVEDGASDQSYVTVRGRDLDALALEVTRKIPTYYDSELVDRAHHEADHDAQVTNLYRLAIAFPDYDPEVAHIFEAFATEPPNPLLRRAALEAMVYRAWPENRSVLERAAKGDADPGIRARAQELLEHWGTAGARDAR
jgi:hypothetical protein